MHWLIEQINVTVYFILFLVQIKIKLKFVLLLLFFFIADFIRPSSKSPQPHKNNGNA